MASDFAVGPLPLPTPGEDTFMVLGHVTEGIRSSACQILSCFHTSRDLAGHTGVGGTPADLLWYLWYFDLLGMTEVEVS